jgi:pyruvate,water dikinase
MRPLWAGLADERVDWDESQLHMDWETFDRISAGIFRKDSRILASYSIIASEYMHLNIRFGYHFSIVDALCGEFPGANYIKFRFKGGGAALSQRAHRLTFIRQVLERFGYEVLIKGDMLDAAYMRMPVDETARCLYVLGLVLAVTRLMDMKLAEASDAQREATLFMQRFFPEERI